MKWIKNYQLFLFDFDGLLVDTESLHFEAYQLMCARRGLILPWDFKTFTTIAHFSAVGLKEKLYETLPALYAEESDWSVLYKEKQANYRALLQEKGAPLMPGVEALLEELAASAIKRVVVTNSIKEQVDLIVSLNPLLTTIPHWITREQYQNPKPSGDCYQLAVARHKVPGERVIGFEDTPRGINALLTTEAEAVLVSHVPYPELGVRHVLSIEHLG